MIKIGILQIQAWIDRMRPRQLPLSMAATTILSAFSLWITIRSENVYHEAKPRFFVKLICCNKNKTESLFGNFFGKKNNSFGNRFGNRKQKLSPSLENPSEIGKKISPKAEKSSEILHSEK